jgi:hypothetical protein
VYAFFLNQREVHIFIYVSYTCGVQHRILPTLSVPPRTKYTRMPSNKQKISPKEHASPLNIPNNDIWHFLRETISWIAETHKETEKKAVLRKNCKANSIEQISTDWLSFYMGRLIQGKVGVMVLFIYRNCKASDTIIRTLFISNIKMLST